MLAKADEEVQKQINDLYAEAGLMKDLVEAMIRFQVEPWNVS